MGKPISKEEYSKRMRILRPLVDFDFDLRKPLASAQKAKITRYYQQFLENTGSTYKLYRPRKKQNLKAARHDTGIRLKGFKAFPVPVASKSDKIKMRKGKLQVKGDNVRRVVYNLDPSKLAKNGIKEIERVFKSINPKPDGVTFLYGSQQGRKIMVNGGMLQNLIADYEKANGYGREQQFVTAIVAFYFNNQKNFFEYLKERDTVRRSQKRRTAKKKK